MDEKVIAKILLVTNEAELGVGAPGVHDVFQSLATERSITVEAKSSWRPQQGESPQSAAQRLTNLFASTNYDFAFVISPRAAVLPADSLGQILSGLRGRKMIIWEGDPVSLWPKKAEYREWIAASSVVFSQYGSPQPEWFQSLGATAVFHVPATYCHVQFAEIERRPPSTTHEAEAVMIASNNRRASAFKSVPGARERYRLASRMGRELGHSFKLYGRNWPARMSAGAVGFSEQGTVIRTAALSVNSDNTPSYSDSSSNRLPISMLAGRVHVTSSHPGMRWAPGPDVGLHVASSGIGIAELAVGLLESNRTQLLADGLAAHNWARGRVSHRESIRYMLHAAGAIRDIQLPREPWGLLPNPWTFDETILR